MARAAALATPYVLPYRAAIQPAPLFRGGRTVVLRATPAGQLTTQAQQDFDSLATAFALLAKTGALAGSTATVVRATDLEWSAARVTANNVEWEFNLCDLDERAAVVLAQLFLMTQAAHPLASLTVSTPGNAAAALLLTHDSKLRNPYPDSILPPFALQRDPNLGDDVSLYLRFVRDLTTDEQEEVDGTITEWATATSMGCYGVAPIAPERCTILFDEGVTFFNGECEWHMQKYRAHPAALNGLVNLCVALHFRVTPIDEMRLE